MNISFLSLKNTPIEKWYFFPRENEAKQVGSKEDIAIRIEADSKVKIEAMNRSVATNKDAVRDLLTKLNKFSNLVQIYFMYIRG